MKRCCETCAFFLPAYAGAGAGTCQIRKCLVLVEEWCTDFAPASADQPKEASCA